MTKELMLVILGVPALIAIAMIVINILDRPKSPGKPHRFRRPKLD